MKNFKQDFIAIGIFAVIGVCFLYGTIAATTETVFREFFPNKTKVKG